MKKIKITIPDVAKKHIKIVCYLVVSAALAYILSIITADPKLVLLAPVINYLIYAIAEELKKNGFVEAIRNR